LVLCALATAVAPAGTLELPGRSGWYVAGSRPDEYAVRLDETAGRNRSACAVLETRASSVTGFVSLAHNATVSELRGRRLQLSAWVKAERVEGWSGLWMRIDNDKGKGVAFDNMQDRPIRGSADWADHSIVLDVPADGRGLSFGVILEGPGTVWVDDFKFSLVGPQVPVTDFFRRDRSQRARP
jgi:hypothetical protein